MELSSDVVIAGISGILGAVIFFVITQFHLRYTRKAIEKEGRERQAEIITHFDGVLDGHQSDFKTSLNEQGREFKASIVNSTPSTEELTADLRALKEVYNESMMNLNDRLDQFPVLVGEQVKAVVNGMKGWDVKETQMMLDESGVELDEAVSLEEAYLSQDPEIMKASFIKKLNDITLSEEYTDKNPIKALIFQGVKAQVAQYTQALNSGVGPGTRSPTVTVGYRSLGT